MPHPRSKEAERSAAVIDAGKKKFAEIATVLEQALGAKPYLLGDQFSAADVMIGSTPAWGQFLGLLEGRPVLQRYVERLSQRPAFQKAQGD
jgi:glutathione S-transferase